MRFTLVAVMVIMCTAATYGISQAFHIGILGTAGIGFVITTIVINVTGVMRL